MLKELEREFMEKKYKIVSDFIKSKLEFWKQVPALYYTSNGKGGWSGNHWLEEMKLYKVSERKHIYINCMTGEFGTMFYNEDEPTYGLDSHWFIGAWIMEMGTDLDDIDGEKVAAYYNGEIDRCRHSTVCQVIPPVDWITRAIEANLEITYNQYCRHFDNPEESPEFVISEDYFNEMKEDCTIAITKKALL